MPIYIALLRGVNVGGNKVIPMAALRTAMTASGFGRVETYVQSGNVVFETSVKPVSELVQTIADTLQSGFGFTVPVMLRTARELAAICGNNPFLKIAGLDPAKFHVTFLSDRAPAAAASRLQPLAKPGEEFHLLGREIYLHCPAGYGETKLANGVIEKKLALAATTRNWKTVNTLWEMAR